MSLGGAFRVFLSELAAVGLDPAALCAAARVEPRALHDRVPLGLDELTRILGRAEAMARDVSLGLHMAERASTRRPRHGIRARAPLPGAFPAAREGGTGRPRGPRAPAAHGESGGRRGPGGRARAATPQPGPPMTVRLATAVEGALARGKRTDRETLARSLGMSGKTSLAASHRGAPVPRRGGRGSTRAGGAVARAGARSGGGGGTGRIRRSRGVRKGFPALVRGAPVGVQGTPEAPLLTFRLVRASPPSERRLPHADS